MGAVGYPGRRDIEAAVTIAPCTGPAGRRDCPLPAGPDSCGLVLAAREGIVLLDEQRRILSLNAAARHIFGCAEYDVCGRPFDALLAAPPGVATLGEKTSDDVGADDPHRGDAGNGHGRRIDGSTFPIDFEITRIATARNDGSTRSRTWFAAFVRDLSVETTLQFELHRVEGRLRTLIELSPVAVWVAENDRLTLANRAAAELVGIACGAALVGRTVWALLHADDHAELRRQLAWVLSHIGKPGKLQARLLRDDGDVREVEIVLAALPDDGRTTVQMVASDVSQRNHAARETERSRQLFRRLSANVVEAREEERRRIARELHDDLGQGLSALKMDIADCACTGALPAANWRVSALLAHLDRIMQSVRRIAADLRPPMLDDLGLGDAIEALAADFSRRLDVQVHLRLDPAGVVADDKVTIAVYRMVQEGLTNVARHSHATEVDIELRRQGGELVLSLRDNGVGMPVPTPLQRDSQFGLLGMQERADALGGRLEIENPREGGARVIVHLPLEARGPAAAAAGAAAPVV